MEKLIVVVVLFLPSFAIGIFVGIRLTWWYMNREWKRNPYQFRAIVDTVIALREARDKEQAR